jgi:hypothetical protein
MGYRASRFHSAWTLSFVIWFPAAWTRRRRSYWQQYVKMSL